MDGNGHGALSDAALDRELDAALNVDPSPEFQARLRLRVARDEIGTGWRLQWRLAGAVAAIATLALAVITLWPAERRDVQRQAVTADPAPAVVTPVPASMEAAVSEPSIGEPGPASIVGRSVRAPAVETPAASSTASASSMWPLPEVLVSADEVRAYERLFAVVRQETPAPAARAGSTAPSETVDLADLAIAPLIIEPLPQMARLQTGELQ